MLGALQSAFREPALGGDAQILSRSLPSLPLYILTIILGQAPPDYIPEAQHKVTEKKEELRAFLKILLQLGMGGCCSVAAKA
jgi:hypothetical protein